MVDFVIGDVCVDVPAGISLKTSEDGSCVTLDFSSGYSGKCHPGRFSASFVLLTSSLSLSLALVL